MLDSIRGVKLKSYLFLFGLSLVWGSSFFLIKKSLIVFSALEVAALRMGISGIVFLPILIAQWSKIDMTKWLWLLLVGLTGSGLPAILYATAQTELASNVTGILNSLTPLFTLLIGVLFFGVMTMRRRVTGVLVGLSGALLMILWTSSGGEESGISYEHAFYVLLATISYGFSGNIVGSKLTTVPAIALSSASFFMVSIPALTYLMYTDIGETVMSHQYGLTSLGAVAVLAVFGTVGASVFFYQLVKDTSPVFASTVAYLIPVIALLIGALDGEPLFIQHIAGMMLILIGVYMSKS